MMDARVTFGMKTKCVEADPALDRQIMPWWSLV
jgi:hypothetical protein